MSHFRRLLAAATSIRNKIPVGYQVLTLCIFAPLFFSFIFQIQFYPISLWSLFTEAVPQHQGRTYYILRGEESDGTLLDIRPIDLTDALSGRNFTMVGYVLDNSSFYCDSPHPNNMRCLASHGGSIRALPKGTRMADLLHSWGRIYNDEKAKDTKHRLKTIRLDGYCWPGREYGDFRELGDSWEVTL